MFGGLRFFNQDQEIREIVRQAYRYHPEEKFSSIIDDKFVKSGY